MGDCNFLGGFGGMPRIFKLSESGSEVASNPGLLGRDCHHRLFVPVFYSASMLYHCCLTTIPLQRPETNLTVESSAVIKPFGPSATYTRSRFSTSGCLSRGDTYVNVNSYFLFDRDVDSGTHHVRKYTRPSQRFFPQLRKKTAWKAWV